MKKTEIIPIKPQKIITAPDLPKKKPNETEQNMKNLENLSILLNFYY